MMRTITQSGPLGPSQCYETDIFPDIFTVTSGSRFWGSCGLQWETHINETSVSNTNASFPVWYSSSCSMFLFFFFSCWSCFSSLDLCYSALWFQSTPEGCESLTKYRCGFAANRNSNRTQRVVSTVDNRRMLSKWRQNDSKRTTI